MKFGYFKLIQKTAELTTDVRVRLNGETEKAYNVIIETKYIGEPAEDYFMEAELFLPKSQCELTDEGISIPEWLLNKQTALVKWMAGNPDWDVEVKEGRAC
jgi:hypothetical protein